MRRHVRRPDLRHRDVIKRTGVGAPPGQVHRTSAGAVSASRSPRAYSDMPGSCGRLAPRSPGRVQPGALLRGQLQVRCGQALVQLRHRGGISCRVPLQPPAPVRALNASLGARARSMSSHAGPTAQRPLVLFGQAQALGGVRRSSLGHLADQVTAQPQARLHQRPCPQLAGQADRLGHGRLRRPRPGE
jgi:hypothetical protein